MKEMAINIKLVTWLDKLFKRSLLVCGFGIIALMGAICATLVLKSMLSFKTFGFQFIWMTEWDPVFEVFGAYPFLVGTLLTSFLALLISTPVSISLAVFLGEYVKKGPVSVILSSTIELLAGIPSVIYGFWGIFVLVPFVRKIQLFFGVAPYGVGIFTASLILAIMIIPYAASIGREVIKLVPQELKEASLSLGSTRSEMIRHVILPYSRSGIFSGVFLSLGRAIGETMAVTMVIGNSNFLPSSIFDPGNTMASVIANEFAEAAEPLYVSSLVQIGLVLFIATTIFSFIGRQIIKKWSVDAL